MAASERIKLANLCYSKEWSKAIRVLDSLLDQSLAIQDICQLELHKHTIKDCDKALQLDPGVVQAYILKGQALSALGRKEEALFVWKKGRECAISHSTDLKQVLELEELLKIANGIGNCNGVYLPDEVSVSSIELSDSGHHPDTESTETIRKQNILNGKSEMCNGTSTAARDIQCNSNHNTEIDIESSGKYIETKDLEYHSNGNHHAPISNNLEPCGETTNTTAPHVKQVRSKLSVKQESLSKSGLTSDALNRICSGGKQNKKFSLARISDTNSVTVDFRLSRGISQVNEGKYAQAIAIFDKILKGDPTYPEALIGRGTAYAFQRELHAAIDDFTEALKSNPYAVEAWKRRGQAQAALGQSVQAIADLTKALEYDPNSSDGFHERGLVYYKFKHYDAAVKDLSACVALDKTDKSAYSYLGLSLSSLGDFKGAEENHLKAIHLDKNFLEAWVHLTQLYVDLADSTKALECIQEILEINSGFAKAYYLRGLLFHGLGDHRKAIENLSMSLDIEKSNIDSLYLRASCYHAVGEYGKATEDYDTILGLDLETMEKFIFQCLAFYQNEIALYTASKLRSEFCWFDIDGDIDPLFKEYWCKRLHPKNVCEKVFRQPAIRDTKRTKIRKQDSAVTKQKTALQNAADSVGCKIQYQCPGFLPNRRQHRMAGLAAIEIAQKVSKVWRSLHLEWKHANKNTSKHGKKTRKKEKVQFASQNRGGDCCSTTSLSETSASMGTVEDKPSGRSMMPWHDIYSLAVKWRQISEPCDPVVWINKLSEEFNSGFGSNTPIVMGQAKVVRYFSNYARTLDVAKTVIKEKKNVMGKGDEAINLSEANKLKEIMHAESCSDLHRIIGEDFWLATWCTSTAVRGKQLEGTRITVLKNGEVGHDFGIRTPCTPSRWDDFDAEMTIAWDAVCDAYCADAYGSTSKDVLENVKNAILRMTYYWYNFMPLSRGSASVGFIVLLGLLMAVNLEFTGMIPEGVQVDWDAILNFNPESFIETVKSWLYPSLTVSTSWKGYPDVTLTLPTVGSIVAALSPKDK
uniref:Suppressor of RPS4-RLD 1 n=1 Tax=Kalanchoe fedtschenkoi TaxID=63787 RepID=A0A7N0ULP9_KALFE